MKNDQQLLLQLVRKMNAFEASYNAMGWLRTDTAEMTCSVLLQKNGVRMAIHSLTSADFSFLVDGREF